MCTGLLSEVRFLEARLCGLALLSEEFGLLKMLHGMLGVLCCHHMLVWPHFQSLYCSLQVESITWVQPRNGCAEGWCCCLTGQPGVSEPSEQCLVGSCAEAAIL